MRRTLSLRRDRKIQFQPKQLPRFFQIYNLKQNSHLRGTSDRCCCCRVFICLLFQLKVRKESRRCVGRTTIWPKYSIFSKYLGESQIESLIKEKVLNNLRKYKKVHIRCLRRSLAHSQSSKRPNPHSKTKVHSRTSLLYKFWCSLLSQVYS